ncbi:hypothetical protein GmHk_U059795 [Glycine max]|nr:hypothetical protein GmHk_U059795 [Glycine max]
MYLFEVPEVLMLCFVNYFSSKNQVPMNMNNIFNNSNQPSFFNSGQDPHQNNQNGFSYQALKAHFESTFYSRKPFATLEIYFHPGHANSQREMIPKPFAAQFFPSQANGDAKETKKKLCQQEFPGTTTTSLWSCPQYRANLFPCAIPA